MNRGIATFTLDYGVCPPWLFQRMVKLGRSMIEVMIDEFGPDEFVKRIGQPAWFQSLGTVLAFDWNASGLTTILTAALKEAIRGQERDLGVFICGGKGKTSKKTPEEIKNWSGNIDFSEKATRQLVFSSKMAAKVDSSLIQDGFQIYHHSFFFSKNGAWTVVQQGMNIQNQTARRYHWSSSLKENFDFVDKPHLGIVSQIRKKSVLDLTAKISNKNRELSLNLVDGGFKSVMKNFKVLDYYQTPLSQSLRLQFRGENLDLLNLERKEFQHHPVEKENFFENRYLRKIINQVCEVQPKTYQELVSLPGVGPKTVRALSLVGEVIYGAKPSYQDPARFSFAFGGKDATPYPVDCPTYDQAIQIMKQLVAKAKINPVEKDKILFKIGK
ncbi:MAG: DUF763 domain-containing protein [Patescibacteria group bacterium]